MDLRNFLDSVNWEESSPIGREYSEFDSTGLVNHNFRKEDKSYRVVLKTVKFLSTLNPRAITHHFRVEEINGRAENYVLYRAFSSQDLQEALAIHSATCQYFEREGFKQFVSQEAA